MKRAQAAGAPAIAVTLDVRSPAKWETFVRLRRTDTRECGSCHGVNDYLSRKPNFEGIDLGGVSSTIVTNLTWDMVKRLRDMVKVKLVLKGILAAEDAKLAADNGVDAIVVSNHGGRVEDGVGATIDLLPEIVDAVGGRMPILIDSGFRRGSDIVKALALGATGRMHRASLSLGTRRIWSARRRARAGNHAHGDAQRDATARRTFVERPVAGDGAAGLNLS